MKILVTGGLGYIGSHVTVLLLERDIEVVCVDNLSNSRREVLEGIQKITGKKPLFYELDLKDEDRLSQLIQEQQDLDGVIHFAAYKAVGESVSEPLKYYENNIGGLVSLLKIIQDRDIPLIFSSSCTVYGQAKNLPITEETPEQPPSSPYGATKQMGEQIIRDCCNSKSNFKAILLRYFNPIGAHPSALIGEYPRGIPQNLVPYLTQTVIGKHPELNVFGSQYDTPDGTCIRDYIHVMDLAQAHISSLEFLVSSRLDKPYAVFNVGTGKGTSVLELIDAFEKATQMHVPYRITDPREGDTVAAYASVNKIESVMGWKAQYSLEQALETAWEWEKQITKKE